MTRQPNPERPGSLKTTVHADGIAIASTARTANLPSTPDDAFQNGTADHPLQNGAILEVLLDCTADAEAGPVLSYQLEHVDEEPRQQERQGDEHWLSIIHQTEGHPTAEHEESSDSTLETAKT